MSISVIKKINNGEVERTVVFVTKTGLGAWERLSDTVIWN